MKKYLQTALMFMTASVLFLCGCSSSDKGSSGNSDTDIVDTERCEIFSTDELDEESPLILDGGVSVTGRPELIIHGNGDEIAYLAVGEHVSFIERVNGIATFGEGDDAFVLGGVFSKAAVFGKGQVNETELIASGNDVGYPDTEVFLAKYDGDGQLLWVEQIRSIYYDDNGLETLDAIRPLKDGSVVVRGEFIGEAVFAQGTSNETTLTTYEPEGDATRQNEEYLARYDKNGNLLWARLLAEGDTELINFFTIDVRQPSISILNDAAIVVVGAFWDDIVFEPGAENETVLSAEKYQTKMYIAKYTADGEFMWAVSDGDNRIKNLVVETLCDHTILVAGYFESDQVFGKGTKNETVLSMGISSTFIARYEPDGTFKKAFVLGKALARSSNLSAFKDGTYLVAGDILNSGVLFPGTEDEQIVGKENESTTIVLMHLDQYDRPLWVATASSSSTDGGTTSVTALPDGSAVVSGYFRDDLLLGEGEENETLLVGYGVGDAGAYKDSFVARYYSDGRLAWARAINGAYSEAPVRDMDQALSTAYLPSRKMILVGGDAWGQMSLDLGKDYYWSADEPYSPVGYHDWYLVGYSL